MKSISSALRTVVAEIDAKPWADKIKNVYGLKTTMMPGVVDEGALLRQTYQALENMPPAMVKDCGIHELIFRNDMGPNRTHYPNHGYFTPHQGTVTLNADIFYNPDWPDDFFDHHGYFISRPVQTIVHEFAHGYDEYNGMPSLKPDWLSLSGWSETYKPGLKRLVIREEGCPEHRGEWFFDPKSEFTRFYGKKNPWDDYADCFSFYVGGLIDACPAEKRKYFNNHLAKYYK